MLDLLIKGGQVVSPDDTLTLDVGVRGGRIVSLMEPEEAPLEAARTIDATGKYLIPGGIDAHVHFGMRFPAFTFQSPYHGTVAAACGGTTTIMDFAWQQTPRNGLMQAIEEKLGEMKESVIDYALHAIMSGELTLEEIEEIPEAIAAGVPTIKMFSCFPGGSGIPGFMVDDGRMWGVFEQLAKHDGMAVLHVEGQCICEQATRKLYREGRTEFKYAAEGRPNIAEETALRRMLVLSRWTGASLYFVHLAAKESVVAVAEARSQGMSAYGEVLNHYLNFTSDDYSRPNGVIYHNYPPLKYSEDREALWRGVKDGTLSVVATDDGTVPFDIKMMGQKVDNMVGGNNGVETRMMIMYSEGVVKGRITINEMVAATSTKVAKLFGMYPRKGIILPGSDADMVILDPAERRRLSLQNLHSDCDYTVWEGWEVQGFPIITIARGKVVFEDGKFLGTRGAGEYIPRKMPADVLGGPAI